MKYVASSSGPLLNYGPGIKTGHKFYIGLYREKLKIVLVLNHNNLDIWYFSIKWTSTKFVRIMTLKPKMVCAGHMIFRLI